MKYNFLSNINTKSGDDGDDGDDDAVMMVTMMSIKRYEMLSEI